MLFNMDNDMPKKPPQQEDSSNEAPKEEIKQKNNVLGENNDAENEDFGQDDSEPDMDLEEMLSYKLAVARMKLKRTTALYALFKNAQLHELSRMQKKRQDEMVLTMFHYVKRRHDIRSRHGRCPSCKYLRSIFA